MRRTILAICATSLITSAASASQLLSSAQWNTYFGETAPNVTTLHMFFDGTEVNFHPLYTDIGAGNQVTYVGSEFPWHPSPSGEGLRFEFDSSPGKDFHLIVPMGGLGVGGHDSNDCTTNLSDVCGAHFSQSFPDPTYDYIVFNLNDYNHESVSLPDDINVRTNIGATVFFYGGTVPSGPEPTTVVLLTMGACGLLVVRRISRTGPRGG